MSEVKGYAVRITQNNDLSLVMSEKPVELIKKYNGCILASEAHTLIEQMKYLGTAVFLKKEEAEGFFREAANIGIEVYFEKNRPIVDDKYFKGGYK